MNHKNLQILVSAYADGEGTPKERQAVERHLTGCAGCRSLLLEIASMREKIRTAADLKTSAGFALRVAHKVHVKHEQQIEWTLNEHAARWTMLALSGAAALWIAIAGFSSGAPIPETAFVSQSDSTATMLMVSGDDASKTEAYLAVMTK